MPLRSLSTRIAVSAGFFVLLSVGALAFVLIRTQREQMLSEVVHGSESIAEAILLSTERDMRVNRREGVEELLAAEGRHAGIESIRIFNKEGRISFSSRPGEVGRVVDKKAEACVQCHAGDTPPQAELDPRKRSRIFTGADGKPLLGTMYVIRNGAGCEGAQCHVPASQQRVLGVLDVAMSLGPAESRLAAATRSAILLALAAVALITATLFLLIRRSVQRPIKRMVAATRKVAVGDVSLAVPPGTAREIGILAGAFNEMVESLASSRHEVEHWASTLEEKVSATAEELREAQFQVAQADKLSSVGLVAAGIAHELNSPLMAIITFAHLVKSAVPAEGQAQEDLRMIEREANRCAAIIRQLLDYSRKQAQEPDIHPCRLRPIVEGALELLKIEVQNCNVALSLTMPEDLPEVDGNEVQLMQVFVNLMMNAVQAMPNGGSLAVKGEVVRRSSLARLHLPPHPSSSLVKITVHDTGTGIPRESLSRVFDPFFTTKPVGKGSGLGLSVSLGLVNGYRGTILVDSDGASWTEFAVILPVSEQGALVASR